MADAVDTIVLINGGNLYSARLTNISDGTGESAVVKVDKSALIGPKGVEPGRLSLTKINWSIQGFTSVRLFWDHTTDDEIAVLSGVGERDYSGVGGLVDPASAGGTGDILLTTAGTAAGNTYDIWFLLRLKS